MIRNFSTVGFLEAALRLACSRQKVRFFTLAVIIEFLVFALLVYQIITCIHVTWVKTRVSRQEIIQTQKQKNGESAFFRVLSVFESVQSLSLLVTLVARWRYDGSVSCQLRQCHQWSIQNIYIYMIFNDTTYSSSSPFFEPDLYIAPDKI